MGSPLTVSGLLAPERILVGLKAEGYKEAVDRLLDRVEAAGLITDRPAIDAMVEAEAAARDLPTLGPRTLLAHYRCDAVKAMAVAVGTARRPFPFVPPTAPGAVFLLLIVAPPSATRLYLKTIASFSQILADAEVADALAAAKTPDAFLQTLAQKDLVIRPELTVRDLMSREVHSVSPEMLLSEALGVMVRHRRRGVPVVSDNGEVLGMVTEREVLQHFLPQVLGGGARLEEGPAPVRDVEVRDVMQRSVMCLSENQLISELVGTMLAEQVSQFPVVKEGKVVGFLSRSDIIRKLLEQSVQKGS
jgi:CBS domain-containing protein